MTEAIEHTKKKRRYRTIWISDTHLGTPGCEARAQADFHGHHECEHLYLVGDIIDGWRLKSVFFWPQEHTNVIRKILTRAKRGTEVVYITGNHDEFLRKFVDYRLQAGNIRLANELVHTTADGRELLVFHGDVFDVITRYHTWVAVAGDAIYNGLMKTNRYVNTARKTLGMQPFSLAAYAKRKVKTAVNIVSEFEESVAKEVRRRGLDGAVCGHIHHAEIREIDDVMYYNCGDWVDSCTALVEDFDGTMEIVHWPSVKTEDRVVPLQQAKGKGKSKAAA